MLAVASESLEIAGPGQIDGGDDVIIPARGAATRHPRQGQFHRRPCR